MLPCPWGPHSGEQVWAESHNKCLLDEYMTEQTYSVTATELRIPGRLANSYSSFRTLSRDTSSRKEASSL